MNPLSKYHVNLAFCPGVALADWLYTGNDLFSSAEIFIKTHFGLIGKWSGPYQVFISNELQTRLSKGCFQPGPSVPPPWVAVVRRLSP